MTAKFLTGTLTKPKPKYKDNIWSTEKAALSISCYVIAFLPIVLTYMCAVLIIEGFAVELLQFWNLRWLKQVHVFITIIFYPGKRKEDICS